MTFRVLVADTLPKEGLATFSETSEVELHDEAGISREDLLAKIGEFDGLVVRSRTKADAELIGKAKRLQVIGRAGIGVDNIDVEAATRAGIVVMNTPDGNATTTAEHALSLIMAMTRQIPQATASMKAGLWEKKKFMGRELSGKTLGLLGLGNIGRIVANRAQGLNMKVVAHDPFFDADAARKLGVESVDLETLLGCSDVISVHAPLNDSTRGMISHAQIEQMKPGVMLVNCARGGIYDEEALLAGLESNKIASVALDVFVEEPTPEGHPLVNHERVICTPHLGASTKEAQVQVAIDVAQQISELATGAPARNAINLPRISAAELRKLGPYLALANRMGVFLGQLQGDDITGVEVTVAGEVAEHDIRALGTAAISGVLARALSRPVNAVNAKVLAEERGITMTVARTTYPAHDYASTIEVRITGAGDSTHSVVGAVFGKDEGRLVGVDGVALEAIPEGHLLLIVNRDRPGVIGHIGAVLGDAGVNISRMHLGLDAEAGTAISLVSLDREISSETLKQLEGGEVVSVKHIAF